MLGMGMLSRFIYILLKRKMGMLRRVEYTWDRRLRVPK